MVVRSQRISRFRRSLVVDSRSVYPVQAPGQNPPFLTGDKWTLALVRVPDLKLQVDERVEGLGRNALVDSNGGLR
jgi:hypothetical protein